MVKVDEGDEGNSQDDSLVRLLSFLIRYIWEKHAKEAMGVGQFQHRLKATNEPWQVTFQNVIEGIAVSMASHSEPLYSEPQWLVIPHGGISFTAGFEAMTKQEKRSI